jgi:hypothetical protein
MTNNSGKFVSQVSNMETEMTATELSSLVPETPKVTLRQSIEEYFGKFWWIWLVILLIIKIK